MLSKIDTGDMKQEVEDEAITFEDINPMCPRMQAKTARLCTMY